MDALARIKRLVLARRVLFTAKAEDEMACDGLTHEEVFEAIVNAPAIAKTIRSSHPRTGGRETLYVIKGMTYDGLVLYTKGKILHDAGTDIFYVFISSKRSTDV